MSVACDSCPKLDVRLWRQVDGSNEAPATGSTQANVEDFRPLTVKAPSAKAPVPAPTPAASLSVRDANVSIIFANADKIRGCTHCKSLFSETFAIPDIWWTDACRTSNGYFGYEDVLSDPNSGRWWRGDTASWVRFIVKRTWINEDGSLKYDWPKLNTFARWYASDKRTHIIIFDPPDSLTESITEHLLKKLKKEELSNPFWVYPRMIEEIVKLQDLAVWEARDLARVVEKHRGDLNPENPDYLRLHEIARHIIHVSETLTVATSTVKSIQTHHERFLTYMDDSGNVFWNHVRNRLSFHHHMLDSLRNRSESNRARLANEIGLAFNTVAQYDSRVSVEISKEMRVDSAAMRTIAFVTLIFLPGTFISALFSMSFFDFDAEKNIWAVSKKFWIYWVVAGPVTLISISLWYNWWRKFQVNHSPSSISSTSTPGSASNGGVELQSIFIPSRQQTEVFRRKG